MKPDKNCFYYDKNCGCCTCAECFIEKCDVAVLRMTPEERRFYGVSDERYNEVLAKSN